MNPMEDPFQGVVSLLKKNFNFFLYIVANAILKFKSNQSTWNYISSLVVFCREWLQTQPPLKIRFIRRLKQNTDWTMRMWTILKLWFFFLNNAPKFSKYSNLCVFTDVFVLVIFDLFNKVILKINDFSVINSYFGWG